MSVFFIKAIQLLLSLSILVIIHELGHFIPAKAFKTRVEKFYLFFDIKFSLFKKKIGETIYGIGWLPLGGYVKIAGMVDESMDTEQLAKPPQPWEFRSKPAWQRLIIMLGGVFMNFILAFFIYAMLLFVWGTNYSETNDIKYGFSVAKTLENYGLQQGDKIISINGTPFKDATDINTYLMFRKVDHMKVQHLNGTTEDITLPKNIGTQLFEAGELPGMAPRYPFQLDSILPEHPAAKAGLLKTDKIVSVNGKPINFYSDFTYALKNKPSDTIHLQVEREDSLQSLTIVPNEDNKIGIVTIPSDKEYIKTHHKEYSFFQSIPAGIKHGYWTIKDYLGQFKYIFTKKGASQVGGFAAIGKMFPDQWNWQQFWALTAFLSIMLGVLNLLPIPALDGGHVMFLLFEIISGRKPNDKFMEYAQIVGFIILLTLVILANGNDLIKAISG